MRWQSDSAPGPPGIAFTPEHCNNKATNASCCLFHLHHQMMAAFKLTALRRAFKLDSAVAWEMVDGPGIPVGAAPCHCGRQMREAANRDATSRRAAAERARGPARLQ